MYKEDSDLTEVKSRAELRDGEGTVIPRALINETESGGLLCQFLSVPLWEKPVSHFFLDFPQSH